MKYTLALKNSATNEIEGHAWAVSSREFLSGHFVPEEYTVQQVFKG